MPFNKENAAAYGKRGGSTTYQRHGSEHMRQIGRKGFAATVRKHYNGDARAYVNQLIAKGLQALDPAPDNGAWQPGPDGTVPDRLPANWHGNKS